MITQQEQLFLSKMNVNNPKLSPQERRQRRLAFRNEMSLYKRQCSKKNNTIVSIHHKNTPFPVFQNDIWWGDSWDAKDYAMEYEPNRDFFEQYKELQNKVPRPAIINYYSENSEFTNCVSHNKDCYLIYSSDFNRNCYYSRWIQHCVDCIDCYMVRKSELAYECIYSQNIYNSCFLEYCSTVSESYFLYDCRNCQNCFMSSGLRNAKYVFKNKQLSKEEYHLKIKEYLPLQSQNYGKYFEEFKNYKESKADFHFFGRTENCNDSNYLTDCQNIENSFFLDTDQNMTHCSNNIKSKHCVDIDYGGEAELAYNSIEAFPFPYHAIVTSSCYSGDHVEYSELCMNCSNVFGCIGLRRKKNCILNKEYSEEEYLKIKNDIIQKMKAKGEYGQFFPSYMSPFGYNETNAQDEYPLSESEAAEKGFLWHTKEQPQFETFEDIPRNITETNDDVLQKRFACLTSQKGYKVISQELELYRKIGVSIPFECPAIRIRRRNAQLNPSL